MPELKRELKQRNIRFFEMMELPQERLSEPYRPQQVARS
jgi:hypothetical protein